jgi:hypothetical protein
LITLRFCLGIWWRRSWFSLNGKMGTRGTEEGQSSYGGPACSATSRIHATAPPTSNRRIRTGTLPHSATGSAAQAMPAPPHSEDGVGPFAAVTLVIPPF